MWLAALIVTVFAIQIGWAARNIRRDFGERGLQVRRIRWQPLRQLFDWRWTRRQMLYRVSYSDRKAEPYSCLVVWTIFQGFTTEEQRREVVATRTPLELRGPAHFPWLALASSIVACAAIGFGYWTAPYNRLNLPDGLIGPGLALVAVLAGLVHFLEPRRWRSTLPIMALAPVATVIVRIVVDLARDPTSHNLFPFELVIAGFVGAVTAALGTGIVGLVRRFTSAARAPHA